MKVSSLFLKPLRAISEELGNWSLFITLLLSDLKQNAASTRLGAIWWFLDPLAMMAVFYFLVRVVFERGGEDYHLFILSALIGWQWFARSLNSSAGAVLGSAGLMAKGRIPLLTVIIVPIITNAIYCFFGFLIIKLIAWSPFTLQFGWLLIAMIVQIVLTVALGTLLSIATVYLPDTKRALGFILRAWWFLSPVLYDVSKVLDSTKVPEWAKDAFLANPMTTLLPIYRSALLNYPLEGLDRLPLIAAVSVVTLGIAVLLLRSFGRHFLKYA